MDRRTISGAGSDIPGSVSDGSLPAITGTAELSGTEQVQNVTGCIYSVGNVSSTWGGHYSGTKWWARIGINAYNSSPAYWRSDNQVHARNVKMYFCVKYI